MEKSEVRKLWFRQNRVVELVIRQFWLISVSKQSCRAGYTSILAYFYISSKNYLTKQIMASKYRFVKSKNAFIVKLPNLA